MATYSTILIAEDNEDIRQCMEFCLTDEGYRVHLAPDGKIALAIVQTQPIDLILLDVHMPFMGGLEFLEEYRKLDLPRASVILMSASSKERVNARRHHMSFLDKPFDITELLEQVEGQLQKPNAMHHSF
jgi:DNA-binding response OmpR family regulator